MDITEFARLGEVFGPETSGPEQILLFDRLERERDALRAALLSGTSSQVAARLGVRVAAALWQFWWRRGHLAEGRGILRQVMSRPGATAETVAWARCLAGSGVLTFAQGDLNLARSVLEDSLAMFRELERSWEVASTLNTLGNLALLQGDATSPGWLHEEGLALARPRRDWSNVAASWYGFANLALYQGQYAASQALHDRRLALGGEHQDRYILAASLFKLADLAIALGDWTAAQVLAEQSLTAARAVRDPSGIARAIRCLGDLACQRGDHSTAGAHFRAALAIYRRSGEKLLGARVLVSFAALAAGQDQPGRALRLAGAAAAARGRLSASLLPIDQRRLERALAPMRQRLSPVDQRAAWMHGEMLSLDEAIAEALGERLGDEDFSELPCAGVPPTTTVRRAAATRPTATGVLATVATLTPREHQLLGLFLQGASTRAIAAQLGISGHTVRRHAANITAKLGTRSRREVVARFLGVVDPTDRDRRETGATARVGPSTIDLTPSTPARLSPRQQEVLRLLIAGASNRAIAEHLGISRYTARWHVSNVLATVGARTRAEAVARAIGLADGVGSASAPHGAFVQGKTVHSWDAPPAQAARYLPGDLRAPLSTAGRLR